MERVYSLDWWLLDQEGSTRASRPWWSASTRHADSPAMWDDDYTGFGGSTPPTTSQPDLLPAWGADAGAAYREVVVSASRTFAGNP